jgi:hypothetical protein
VNRDTPGAQTFDLDRFTEKEAFDIPTCINERIDGAANTGIVLEE